MHKGQTIMEGTPPSWWHKKIEKHVLEVRDAEPGRDIQADRIPHGVRADHALGTTRYYGDDIDALRELAGSSLKAGGYLIPPDNLKTCSSKPPGDNSMTDNSRLLPPKHKAQRKNIEYRTLNVQ